MFRIRVFAGLFCVAFAVAAQHPDRPTGQTGREGAEDLMKEAVFKGLDKAMGESGGAAITWGGKTYTAGSGDLLGVLDDLLIDPLVSAATTDGDNYAKLDAFVRASALGGWKVTFPLYGLTIDAGKLVIGTGVYTTEQMIEAVREQQIEAIIFGRGFGGWLGSFNNPLASQNFLTIPKVFNAGITAQNFGAKVQSYNELRDLWFGEYRRVLVKELLMPAADVDAALQEGFGRLEEFWKLQRAGIAAEKFSEALAREILAAKYRAEQQKIAGEMAETEAAIDDGDGLPDDDADNDGISDDQDEDPDGLEIADGGDLDDVFGNDDGDDDEIVDGGDLGSDDDGLLPDDLTLPTGDELADGGTTGELISDDGADGGDDGATTPQVPLTGQIYDLVETKPDPVFDTWVVTPGHVEVSGYGYNGSYDWSSPPQSVGADGFALNLSVTCQTEHGQRFATGIGAGGGFKLEPTHEAPCNAGVDDAQSASVDIRAIPPQQASPGSEIQIKIGAFWGLGVTYKYRAR